MGDWLSYTPSDFLLFSARTYYRLFELYNRAIWPAQILALLLGLVILWRLHRAGAWQGSAVTVILAAGWLWTAWAYLLEQYDTINWAARYFAIGFAIEAVLLIWTGSARNRLSFRPYRDWTSRTGMGLFLFALVVQPLIGPLVGRDWTQAELFGVTPDPTVLATLGILLTEDEQPPWGLMIIPLIWCGLSGATLWTMGSPDAWIMPVAALGALGLAIYRVLSARGGTGSGSLKRVEVDFLSLSAPVTAEALAYELWATAGGHTLTTDALSPQLPRMTGGPPRSGSAPIHAIVPGQREPCQGGLLWHAGGNSVPSLLRSASSGVWSPFRAR